MAWQLVALAAADVDRGQLDLLSVEHRTDAGPLAWFRQPVRAGLPRLVAELERGTAQGRRWLEAEWNAVGRRLGRGTPARWNAVG